MDRPGRPTSGTVLDIAAWAQDALALLSGLPGVRRVGLGLAEGGGRRLRFTSDDRDNHPAPDWCHVDAYDDVPLNTAVRTVQPVVGDLDDLDARYADFVEQQREVGTAAVAAVPIAAAGQALGGFVLYFDRRQSFDREHREGLTGLGRELGAVLRIAQRGEQRPAEVMWAQPVPPGAQVAVHQVLHEAAGVRAARHFLQEVLEAWGVDSERTFAAVLCLSELVTNSVVHAHAGCTVRVLLDDGVLTTTVRDNGLPDGPAGGPADDPLRVHGRGLQLVDAVADRWGSELDSVGTTVWYALAV